jgi:adenylate cyclase
MPQEIERKFLVESDEWRRHSKRPRPIRQGYIVRGPEVVVRVRIFGAHAYLTIKSTDPGRVRTEFEYEIPLEHAEALLAHACTGPVIEKTRHKLEWAGLDWVIDEFGGALSGLVLAEVELHFADQEIDIPPWAGKEVTDDPDYRNERLSLHQLRPGRNACD